LFCHLDGTCGDNLIVDDRHEPRVWGLIPMVKEPGEGPLQTIGAGALDRAAETLGEA
jgi:hypothetical protein